MNKLRMDTRVMLTLMDDINKQIIHAYQQSNSQTDYDATPEMIGNALRQYFETLMHIDAGETDTEIDKTSLSSLDSTPDITQLGEYGLSLLEDMKFWAEHLHQAEVAEAIDDLTIPIALWVAEHDGRLQHLQIIVNQLTSLANHTEDVAFLADLASAMDEIILAVDPVIQQDLDKSNPGRPWRILNLNQGIVATRTHDTHIMARVFDQLTFRLPEDAAAFFAEGMEQMDMIDYPQHVRIVMEKYYQQTHNRTLH